MYYELDSEGLFITQIVQDEPPSVEDYPDWTASMPPQPVDTPKMEGTRDAETGEWTGEWVDLGPKPVPAPLPWFPTTEMANPTIAEWNALCVAAGAPELQK